MDLRLLASFAAVADLGSVSAAATTLHITQPALSRQIQQLERAVGVVLFRRERRRLVLTAAGRTFLGSAREVLAAAASARNLAEALAAGHLERVKVVAPTTTLTDVLAPFLATLDERDPLITVEEAAYGEAVSALETSADLAVLTAPPPRPLASHVVARLPVWAYVAPTHPLAERVSLDVTELAEHRIITLDPRARPRQLLDEALITAAIAPREVLECSNPQVAQALAAAGRGIAVVSDDPRFDLHPLQVLTEAGPLELTLHAAWSPDHHGHAALELLAERLVAFCARRYGSDPASLASSLTAVGSPRGN